MVLVETEKRQLFIGNQINQLNQFGKLLQTDPDVYKHQTELHAFYSSDSFLSRHGPKGLVQRRNQLKNEDVVNFNRFASLVTSLWESQDTVKQAQAEYLLKRLYSVMENHHSRSPFDHEISSDRKYSNKILYDDESISNLADSIMAGEAEAGITLEVTPVTAFGPVVGNRIAFGKKDMVAEFALPITPGNPIANPLEKTAFVASYKSIKPKFIQLEKDLLSKNETDKLRQIEPKFEKNALLSRLVAEATTILPTDPREMAIASARGLCTPPAGDQRITIESSILEFASSGHRPEAVRKLSLPLDQESIPAIEITEVEAESQEAHAKRQLRGETVTNVPKADYVFANGDVLFKATGKYLLYFQDGKLHFSFDYETAKPQDMVSRMRTGMDYFNRIVNRLYEYFQLEPRTVILPLDAYREKTLVDFERLDHHTIEERIEHLGGYNQNTLSRIERFHDDVLKHFEEPKLGKPQNLFLTGPTGVGKTTVTRVLAKAFGENGIPVYKLSDREPINTDTLTRSIKAFIRNKEGGVLIIEDLIDYLKKASPEEFRLAQSSLIQTLKTLADIPNHVVIFNSEMIDEIVRERWALIQPQRVEMMFLEPDTTEGGIESLLRATMARSLSTDAQIITRDAGATTEHLNRISGNNLTGFVQQIQQIDKDFPGVGLTPNMIGTTSRTRIQAGKLDWKVTTMEEILSAIRQNMDTKSRLHPETLFEKARLTAGQYELLVRLLQTIENAGGLDELTKSLVAPLLDGIQKLEAEVTKLSPPTSST